MKIKTEPYFTANKRWPATGQQILSYQQDGQVVVYQAYHHQIADYAVKNQLFGGPHYSYTRMSWIKPNFLWMMHRCGWASKQDQERVLAIWINKADFEIILEQAVFSAFSSAHYTNHYHWKEEINQKDVRLQWDPDHDPFGAKLTRRAIQIGMKGPVLEAFGKQQIKLIEDVTEFVKQQKAHIDRGRLDNLFVPVETVFNPTDEGLRKRIGINGAAL